MRVNDTLIFPQPVKSATMKAAEAENVYGSPVYLNQALYSLDTQVSKSVPLTYTIDPLASQLPSKTVYDYWSESSTPAQDGLDLQSLAGRIHFNAVNLSHNWGDDNDDSILIDQKPIEVLLRDIGRLKETNTFYTTYYFSEVVKRLGIMDGAVQIFQQPAVQTSRQ